jgi:hypothetical protein
MAQDLLAVALEHASVAPRPDEQAGPGRSLIVSRILRKVGDDLFREASA